MLNIIKQRRSIRNYSNHKVSKEDLDQILEAIRYAPSWKNKQCVEVIVVDDSLLQEQIGILVNHNPCRNAYTNATYTLLFIADPSKSGNRDGKAYYMSDAAIAVEHAILCATSLNLATCWVGIFPEEALKQLLNIPEHYRIVALSPLGYANECVVERKRKVIEELVHFNKF